MYKKSTLRVKLSSLYIAFFTAVIFLFPINIAGLSLFNEPIYILSVLGSVTYLIFDDQGFNKNELEILTFGVIFSIFFLLILGIYFPEQFVIKDFVEPIKPFFYSVIVVAGYRLSRNFKKKQLIKYVIYASVISIVFSAFVFLPFLHPIVDLFKGRTSTDSYAIQFYRFSGTIGYPGPFGYWLVFSSLVVLFAYYKKLVSFWKFMAIYGLVVVGVFLTGSKGAIAVYLLVTPFFFMLTINYKKTWYGLSLIGLLFVPALIYVAVMFSELRAVTYLVGNVNYARGLEALRETSFGHRIREFEILIDQFQKGKIFGVGPNNVFIQNLFGPVESVYFYYGYKFGLIGFLFYFLVFLWQAKVLITEILQKKLTLPFIFAVWSVVVLSVGALSASVTEEYKSFYIYFLLYGIFLNLYLRKDSVNIINGKE